MKLSVAYNFDPALIPALARIGEVTEVYGKMDRDIIGGGRASYTLPRISWKALRRSVQQAHNHGILFNYLLNGATLGGLEQTRQGQRRIRGLLDRLCSIGVDYVTVSSPYLLRVIKKCYPQVKVRVSVFATIDSGLKARQWEEMGADTLCISAIGCNRNRDKLQDIRKKTTCELQLIANASCVQGCAYELTHMNLLTESSRKGARRGEFCLDYCFLYCTSRKLRTPAELIRSGWIRPEDLGCYEDLGYDSFKLVERSCPTDLLLRRVQAYANRTFDGNLMELIAPVAHIKKQQGSPLSTRLRVIAAMARPLSVKIDKLMIMKKYAEQSVLHEFEKPNAPVYIDNRRLDGFLDKYWKKNCSQKQCSTCGFCEKIANELVEIDDNYRKQTLSLADSLDDHLHSGSLWF
ncbi:MAG: U32 family peptidase [Fibrobacterota bacterium]